MTTFSEKVHYKPKCFCSISLIDRKKISKFWFLSKSSSRQLFCSFDNPTKCSSSNSRNTSAHSKSEDHKVKELRQKMFYLEMFIRRERMLSFCNTVWKISPRVRKINSKNPQLQRKRFPETWFSSDSPSKQLECGFGNPAKSLHRRLKFFCLTSTVHRTKYQKFGLSQTSYHDDS